jgi:hypothetical protein
VNSLDEIKKIESSLDEEILKIWGEDAFFDGITCHEKFLKAKYRILWILKEVKNKDNKEKYQNRREFHGIVQGSQTFYNIMHICYAILNGIKSYDEKLLAISKDECLINDCIVLDEIAIINVKKSSDGINKTPKGTIDREYQKQDVKQFLMKQINFINPHIIINSSGAIQLFKDLCNDNYSENNAEFYSVFNNRLIIDTSHPLGAPKKYYCDQILKIVFENINNII